MKVIAGVGGVVAALALTTAPAFAAATGNEKITTPSPYTPPVDGNFNPVPDLVDVTGTGWAPFTQVYATVCDGKSPTSPGWSVALDCDSGATPSAIVPSAAGTVDFNGATNSNNYAIGVFRGVGPSDLFNCLAPGDNPTLTTTAYGNDTIDTTVPSYGQTGSAPCQIRLAYATTGAAAPSDQFLPLALASGPGSVTPESPLAVALPLGALVIFGTGGAVLYRKRRSASSAA